MGKSKRNVTKQQSKIPKAPPLPPPLRQTKSSPPAPPPPPPPLPLKSKKPSKEYSSETNNKSASSDKSLPATRSTSKNLVVEKVKDKSRTPQKAVQESGRAKNEPQKIYVSKASWIPKQQAQDDSDDQSTTDESLNQVHFFDEENCSDPDDEFRFTCCVPPFSPRYPPNPRPRRQWDPSVLPTGTNIPTSIGKPCKRCGQEVYLAELHLSSRGVYHTECYKCCLCGKSLDSWSVSEHKSELFCKGCYRRNFALHGCGFGVGAGVLQTP